jgi:hypothetical protein
MSSVVPPSLGALSATLPSTTMPSLTVVSTLSPELWKPFVLKRQFPSAPTFAPNPIGKSVRDYTHQTTPNMPLSSLPGSNSGGASSSSSSSSFALGPITPNILAAVTPISPREPPSTITRVNRSPTVGGLPPLLPPQQPVVNSHKGEVDPETKFTGWGCRTWSDGSRYTGEWLGGKRHGKGIQSYISGNSYEGEWENDVRCGWGVLYANFNRYEGRWKVSLLSILPSISFLLNPLHPSSPATSSACS